MTTTIRQSPNALQSLAKGWNKYHFGHALDFAHQVQGALGQAKSFRTADDNFLEFSLDLSHCCLARLGDTVACMVVAANDFEATKRVKDVVNQSGTRISFLFCTSNAVFKTFRRILPVKSTVLVTPQGIQSIFDADDVAERLKDLLVHEIGRRSLNPYTIGRPAEGSMFFGRDEELEILRENDTTSYAIAGPSLIGKTSLLKRYRSDLVRRHDSRVFRTFLIDMFDCPTVASSDVAQHIAFRISPVAKNWTLEWHRFPMQLRHLKNQLGGTITLLLDEVDEHCSTAVFAQLGNAAKKGDVRLILAGRQRLLEEVSESDSPLGKRLELLRPLPLTQKAATDAIRVPMRDLRLSFSDESAVLDYVFRMTGRLPFLVQFYGKKIIEAAERRDTTTISIELIQEFEGEHETVQFLLAPLRKLESVQIQQIAAHLLRHSHKLLTFQEVGRVANSLGHSVDHRDVIRICNELVIANVLTFERGHLRLANDALRQLAETTELLDLMEERVR